MVRTTPTPGLYDDRVMSDRHDRGDMLLDPMYRPEKGHGLRITLHSDLPNKTPSFYPQIHIVSMYPVVNRFHI